MGLNIKNCWIYQKINGLYFSFCYDTKKIIKNLIYTLHIFDELIKICKVRNKIDRIY